MDTRTIRTGRTNTDLYFSGAAQHIKGRVRPPHPRRPRTNEKNVAQHPFIIIQDHSPIIIIKQKPSVSRHIFSNSPLLLTRLVIKTRQIGKCLHKTA